MTKMQSIHLKLKGTNMSLRRTTAAEKREEPDHGPYMLLDHSQTGIGGGPVGVSGTLKELLVYIDAGRFPVKFGPLQKWGDGVAVQITSNK